MGKLKILVIGDSCMDTFIYCNIDRLCPEAPVPILQPINKVSNFGMAGNVAENLKSLGAEVELITNETHIHKTRYVDNKSGQMIMRFDENDMCTPIQTLGYVLDIISNPKNEVSDYDAIVVSDYCKGFIQISDIELIAKHAKCPLFLDTKKLLGDWCRTVDFIKINKPEMDSNSHYMGDNIIVTDGENGATYKGDHYDVNTHISISNVSGAGDTFLAGLVFSYIKTSDMPTAIIFANECASKVVQYRGVTVI